MERQEGLAKLGGLLSQPSFRRAFRENAQKALQDNRVGGVDQAVIDILLDLSPEELRVLAWVKDQMVAAQVPLEHRAEMV